MSTKFPYDNPPRPAQMGLTRIEGAVGAGIWFCQKCLRLRHPFCPIEHAFFILDDEHVIEAEPGGAVITPLSYYTETYRSAFTVYTNLTLSSKQEEDCIAAAWTLKGRPYNYVTYATLTAKRFGISSLKIDRMIANKKFLMCSQLDDEAYNLGGVHLYQDRRLAQNVIPADLYTDFYLTNGAWPKR